MSNRRVTKSDQHMPGLRELVGLIDNSTWNKIALWTVVSVLTMGIPASVETAVNIAASHTLALGFDDLFTQTAPLILSVAMAAFACHRGWLNESGVIPSAALILFGGWLGHFFQHGAIVSAFNWLPTDRFALLGSVVFAALNLLMAYFISYGAGAFLASVLVGSVLGTVWSKWLFRLQQRFSDLSEQDEPNATSHETGSRRAA